MGEYGEGFSQVASHFLKAATLAKNNEKNVVGIVINAFTEPFVVPREMFDVIASMDSSLEAKEEKPRKRSEPFRFSLAGIPVGAEISFKDDPTKKAVVVNDRKVRYEGKEYSLSALALLLTGKEGTIQGPLWFTYEGEILVDRRKRIAGDN